ncbi:MAG TPA: Xaa-Pro peptidase family protein [Bryobacteraceae bacterium]|nr:Xaa-Pro peptidase family protein [Bryobacteraceae bacterium]
MTEIEQRRHAVATRLGEYKIDALLVSSSANIRYLSDYTGSNGLILITAKESHFFTDPRYGLEASQKVTCKVHVAKGPLIPAAAKLIKQKKLKKIGLESSWIRLMDYNKLKEELPLGYSLHAIGPLIEEQRMIKSLAEIDRIRKSVQANSEAYARTMRRVKIGVREQDLAAELEFQMRMLGAEKPSFDTIVAAGERSALPHAHPTARRFQENELLLIDMGATLDGYSSDMTRVAYAGVPPKQVRDMYRAVLEAQLTAVNAVRAGIPAGKVDATARGVLKKHNLEREFIHSTGHGLGLEIHEPPRIGKKEKTQLKAGMVITIEPGAYIDGFGGIRIEDTVLVTENGCEVLTPTPKEFVSI